MIVWLAACTPDPRVSRDGRSDQTTTPSDSAPAVDTGIARPPFVQPGDAVDIDPDPGIVHVALTAAPFTYTVGDRRVDGYAYNGQVPGPTLRAKVGDRLVVDFTNALPADTTIHWHGVVVPYAMDGVTWQTTPIAPGGTFTYDFTLTAPGTFWYHPHFDSDGQVDLGLYGLLVVEDPSAPLPDRDLLFVFDDWSEAAAGSSTDPHGLQSFPAAWALNGVPDPRLDVRGGEVVRARVLNASNTRYLDLPDVRQLGSDQGFLPAPIDAPALLLAPGDRAELEWRVGDSGFSLTTLPYSLNGGPALGETQELLSAFVSDPSAAPAEPGWPIDEQPPAVDPGTTDIIYVFSGDGDEWLINGESYPDVTIETLAVLGQDAVIEVRNLSPTEHPFHLHGHPFEVLSVDGVSPGFREVEDTFNVRIRQTVRLRLVADNPGDWMAHCHILPHAHEGMMTVIHVGP